MNEPSSIAWASVARALLALCIALPALGALVLQAAVVTPAQWSLGVCLALAMFALAWRLLPAREPVGARALLLTAASVGLVCAWPGAGVHAWLAPVSRDAAGGTAQLLLTFGLLSLACWALQDDSHQEPRWLALISVAAGFVLCMVFRGALPLFAVIVYLATRHRVAPPLPFTLPSRLPRRLVHAGGLMLCVLLSAGGVWSQRAPAMPLDPAAMTLDARAEYHLAEGNRPRALYFARQWQRAEDDPAGNAALFMARVAWSLGDRAQARETARLVQQQGREHELRARAAALLVSWVP